MEISILVLVKNEGKNIDQCLGAIFQQVSRESYEVIVVDSGSTDGTLEKLRAWPVRLVCIPPEEFHHARTRNFAATLAQGKYLIYLAGDAFPATTGWLQALVDNFQDPSVAAVFGRQLPKPGSKIERRQAQATMYGDQKTVKQPGRRDNLGYRYYHFSTVNCAIRKAVWETTRFPEELKVFEDVGIAKRILDNGGSIVYEPAAPVVHSHDYPASILFRRYFDIGVIYQRLGIWDEGSRTTMRRDGWRLLRQKVSLLRRPQESLQVASSAFQDMIKFSGIVLGRNEHLLPLALKKRLSAFRLFD